MTSFKFVSHLGNQVFIEEHLVADAGEGCCCILAEESFVEIEIGLMVFVGVEEEIDIGRVKTRGPEA